MVSIILGDMYKVARMEKGWGAKQAKEVDWRMKFNIFECPFPHHIQAR